MSIKNRIPKEFYKLFNAGEYGVSDASKAGRVGMAPKGL